jgi:hypothetical protein
MIRYREGHDNELTSAMLFVGQDRAAFDQQLGLVPVSLHSAQLVAGTRLSHGRAAWGHWFELGLDGLLGVWELTRAGSLTNPAREGDRAIFGAPLAGAVGSDSWHPILANLAPYALAALRWGRLVLRPGVRLDGELLSGDRVLPPTGLTPREGFSRTYWSLEPRLAGTITVGKGLDLGAAVGIHHQAPDAADLSAVFGSPALGPGRALDGVLSAKLRRTAWQLETAAFMRRLDELAVRNPDPQAAPAQSLVGAGQGRSRGLQVLVRHECLAPTFCGLLAYTFSRSERRAASDAGWRPFDFDQTHVLTAALGYRGTKWYGGARVRYATGMPRTPVAGIFFDAAAGAYRPVPGALNSSRLPAFVEIDLRAERQWQANWGSLSLSLEIVNAANRANAEEIVYSGDYSRHHYITGLPLLVLGGLRVEI